MMLGGFIDAEGAPVLVHVWRVQASEQKPVALVAQF